MGNLGYFCVNKSDRLNVPLNNQIINVRKERNKGGNPLNNAERSKQLIKIEKAREKGSAGVCHSKK